MGASIDRRLMAFQTNLMLDNAPEAVHDRLIGDRSFTDEMCVSVVTTMHLAPGVEITADRFVEAARAALAGATTVDIATGSGQMRFEAALADGALMLTAKEHTIEHPFVEVLSLDREIRLRALERFVMDMLIAPNRGDHWQRLLNDRALTPPEYMDFVRDGRSTPEMLAARLHGSRHLNPSTMVPNGLTYWSALLPIPQPAVDFSKFVNGPLRDYQSRMLATNPELACSRIGYASAASAIIPFELLRNLNPHDVEVALGNEDLFSPLFVFEVAVSRLEADAQWEGIGTRALEQLFADKDTTNRRCELLSAAIVISFAGLARLPEWKDAPLFWRRMAVLAQASVLTDALSALGKPVAFRQWAFNSLGAEYYWRALVDRREGPLWWAHLIEPHTLKAFIAARFLQAMHRIDENRWPAAWRSVAEGLRTDKLDTRERVMMGFPGPLDDFTGYERNVEANLFENTRKALQDKPCKIPGLSAFIHIAKLTEEHLALLREFVTRTSLPSGTDAGLYLTELTTIAHAAGTYRDLALANALGEKAMSLFKQTGGLEREAVLTLLVDAANANADEGACFSWLAQWLERLARLSSTRAEVSLLLSGVQSLVAANPRYRAYLSRARATLEIKKAQPTLAVG